MASVEVQFAGFLPVAKPDNLCTLKEVKRGGGGTSDCFYTMIVFNVLVQDRLRGILAVASLAIWAVLHCASLGVLHAR